jgi:hypothetical protein
MFISLTSNVLFLYENLTSAAMSNAKLYWQLIYIRLCDTVVQQEEFEESVNQRRTDKSRPKEKGQRDKQRSTKHTYKTKDRVTRTPLKTKDEKER